MTVLIKQHLKRTIYRDSIGIYNKFDVRFTLIFYKILPAIPTQARQNSGTESAKKSMTRDTNFGDVNFDAENPIDSWVPESQ